MADDLAAKIVKRLDAMKAQRQRHETTWKDCFDYTYPLRGDGFNSEQLDAVSGQERKARLLDSTATDGARILASAIVSGTTPANSRWFGLAVGQDTDEEERYLDEAAQHLWELIHSGNFDAAAFECATDITCAGWFALYVDEDRERGGLTFSQWPISQLYCAASKAGGRIDTVYRSFQLTAEQAVNEFGADAVSETTAKLAKDRPDEKVEFVHAIYPRQVYAAGARLAKNLPIASCKLEVAAKKLVSESGYHEMPVIVPRWMLLPNSVYAVGPVFDALPDIRMLNEVKRMELAAADIAISGMWIAEDDGVLNPRTIKVGARKVIVANSVDSMKPLQTGASFEVAWTEAKMLQAAIRKTLMADQLQPQDGPAMTATEVHVRVQLLRQLLGPVYGRLQAEYLAPLIERCFGLAYRAGALGTAPESLFSRNYQVKYISPLARAQMLEEVTAIERLTANIGAMQQVMPEVVDLMDGDEAVRTMAEGLGVPTKVIRSADAVQARRDARQQAQQQQAQQARQQEMQGMAMESALKRSAA